MAIACNRWQRGNHPVTKANVLSVSIRFKPTKHQSGSSTYSRQHVVDTSDGGKGLHHRVRLGLRVHFGIARQVLTEWNR